MKIICKSLNGGLIMSNTYQGPSGEQYLFHRNIATEVKNKDDAKYFLNCGGGEFFKSVGKVDEIVEDLKTAVTGNKPDDEKNILGLYELNKKAQIELIKKLGGVNTVIPRYEEDRVSLILRIQGMDKKHIESLHQKIGRIPKSETPDETKSTDNKVDEIIDD